MREFDYTEVWLLGDLDDEEREYAIENGCNEEIFYKGPIDNPIIVVSCPFCNNYVEFYSGECEHLIFSDLEGSIWEYNESTLREIHKLVLENKNKFIEEYEEYIPTDSDIDEFEGFKEIFRDIALESELSEEFAGINFAYIREQPLYRDPGLASESYCFAKLPK